MTQPIIKPTVGRVVWFHPSKNSAESGFSRHTEGEPYAAIVAHVHSDTMVNLSVFDANGVTHSRTSVTLVQGDADAPAYGFYAEWMPFQKGQAAKTEAAEKVASAAVPSEYRQPTQRDQLEYALVSGAASHLAQLPTQAGQIAQGIKAVPDALHPEPGEPLKAAPITLPVIDPGPDSLEREIQTKASNGPRVTPADIEAEIVSEHYFTAAQGVYGADIEQLRAQDQAAPLTLQPMADDPQPWRTSVIGPLSLLTFCVLVLRNGFTVTGESACASPENFDAEIGRKIARENAINKMWPLLGYALKQRLHEGPK